MLHRRDAMIRLGQVGTGALTLPFLLQQEQLAAANRQRPHLVPTNGRAKSCILIYLWGGPPQMDMWDPNPEAPVGIRSLFQPIDTVVPGIRIAEEMPLFWRRSATLSSAITRVFFTCDEVLERMIPA